ncbi:MAG: hypothetical protein FJ363_00620 [Gemmatimonadetes bacterium]|nr:hypothetical protein [Gemmatimonadota bacterium]
MIAGATLALMVAVGAQNVTEPAPGVGPRADGLRVGVSAPATDTVRVRRRAVRLSDAYRTRQRIHKLASFAILPLFAFQYAAGEQLYDKSDAAPDWAKDYHGLAAGGVAGLFALNTVTGSLNWWETRHQEGGRGWRTTHAALMLLAEAGFVATGMLAEDAEGSLDKRRQHRTIALTSMSLASASYLMMLKPLRRD